MGPELALAASARDWPDRVHRFLVDHGGGRVRSRVMSPDQALADDFDILLIDDVCSFLSPRLVKRLRAQGKDVVGVFDPRDGSDAKRHLLECGISDVIETEAGPDEFLSLVAATVEHRVVDVSPVRAVPAATSIGVTGTPGSGVTELAIAVANDLASRHDVSLLDLDLERSSIAQRLDLPPHPNLRTAIDYVYHRSEQLDHAIHALGSLRVVTGLPNQTRSEAQLTLSEIHAVTDDLSRGSSFVMLDLGDSFELIVPELPDIVIVVGTASPVGTARLIGNVNEVLRRNGGRELLAVVNQSPRPSRRADDIRLELVSALEDLPVMMIPTDPKVAVAAWEGQFVTKGRFARSARRLGRILSRALDR